MAKKERLDQLLVDNGYFDTKSRAQASIMARDVKINGETITKAGYQMEIKDDTVIEIKSMPFVSRGGFKLDKAIKSFCINLESKICIDAGASTGGFTDCMLQHNAKKVYAIDVGYGQLAWKLRSDSRVKVLERVNIRNCEVSDIYSSEDEKASFCSMDLSFISITKVLENVKKLMRPENIEIMALIKPQFEAGKEQVGKNGVVKDKNVHLEVIQNIIDFASSLGLYALNLAYSPIKGPAGNREYLIYLSDKSEQQNESDELSTSCTTGLNKKTTFSVEKIVFDAFENL